MLCLEDHFLLDTEQERVYATRFSRRTHWLLEEHQVLGGAEGLKMLGKWPFDGMTLGLIMPHMNGIEFLRQLRRRNQSLPVIVISGGYAQLTASERKFVKDKTQAVLTMPFTPADLEPLLTKCFGVAS